MDGFLMDRRNEYWVHFSRGFSNGEFNARYLTTSGFSSGTENHGKSSSSVIKYELSFEFKNKQDCNNYIS